MKNLILNLLNPFNHRPRKWPSTAAKVWTGLALIAGLTGMATTGQAQVTYALTNQFVTAAGSGMLKASSTAPRGMAYDSVSNLVYVSGNATPYVSAFDGTAGTYLGDFNSTGFSGGTYLLDQVAVAADGAIYGINLATTNTSANKIYRWTNWTSIPTVAAGGNALANGGPISYTSGRLGDTLAATGAGTNTLLLAGVGAKPYFALYYTTNGLTFTNTIITVPSGLTVVGNIFGLCFYTNNTFLVKPASSLNSTVYLVQYPTNFMSQNVVTGVVIASGPLGSAYNNTTMLSYTPGAGFLGVTTTGGNPSPVGLLGAANIAGGVTTLAATNAVTSYNGGNASGGAALGGNGGTNVLYAYNSGDALYAYKIITIPPVAPSIATAPAGGTSYVPYTLTVGAAGTAPYHYFWQASISNSAAGTFTNIPGAITNLLTINSGTNYYQVIITNIAGAITSTPVQVTILKPLTNVAVTNLWQLAAGESGYGWLLADNNERGIAYDTNTHLVVVAASSGLYLLNGDNGTNIGQLSLTGVSFGGLLGYCDQVGIADDGAVYGGNLNNSGGNYNLYRWSAPSNSVTATVAFNTDPGAGQAGGERWGDTLTVRGAGANTQILLGSRASAPGGTNVALLLPNDGVGLTYSSFIIAVSNVPAGFAGYGIAFGAGNTFWAKSYNGDLFEVAFDTNLLTGTVLLDYSSGSQVPSATSGLGIDPVNNLLGLVRLNDNPNDLQLFQLSGTTDSPVLFDQAFFASANGNGNDNVAITMKYPRAYALDVNNGIVALNYGVPATTAPTITTPPASVTAYTNVGSITLSVAASGSLPLHYQWRYNSNNIAGATGSTYTIANTALPLGGYYDVVVHNIAGSITSTPPALITLVVPVTSPLVTPLWNIAPGTNSSQTANGTDTYLTTSGYETRGLAYDPTQGNLLVADHFNIHVYNAATGAYVQEVGTAGLPGNGVNGWVVDQIGVADDGTLYSANLSLDGTGFSIISYAPGSYTPNYAYGGSTGGSDLNSLDPIGDRWGDTMAVRGSGVNTEILFGSDNGTNVALFTTSDGVNFTPQIIAVQGGVPLGFTGLGIAFGTNNTFYAKGGHFYNLRYVSFDTNSGTGTVLQTYTAGTQVPNDLTGLSVDVTNNILGGVCYNNSPHDLELYLLSGNSNGPALFEQDFFPAFNSNVQEDAVVALYGGLGFALDVNNGIVAFSYSLPAAPAVTLTSVAYTPGRVTITWNNTFDGHGYQVYYKNTLRDAAWTLLGTVTATDATASYTDNSAAGATRFYQVVSQ